MLNYHFASQIVNSSEHKKINYLINLIFKLNIIYKELYKEDIKRKYYINSFLYIIKIVLFMNLYLYLSITIHKISI